MHFCFWLFCLLVISAEIVFGSGNNNNNSNKNTTNNNKNINVSLFNLAFSSSSSALHNISFTSEISEVAPLKRSFFQTKTVCRGSSFGLAHPEKTVDRYEQYKLMYSNCTHVDGNLEIVFLDSEEAYELEFLKAVQEVSGYVLIVGNYADYMPLRNLKVIRGRTLFEHENSFYALYVALNYDPDERSAGLKELQLTSLQEILKGNVFIFHNNQLCYEDTIDWSDVFMDATQKVHLERRDNGHPQRICEKCHASCVYGNRSYCWGEGPDMCQKLRKQMCSPQCEGRCFGVLANECCHSECSGGCTGPKRRDCWSCKNFENEGSCESHCPAEHVYSPSQFKQVPNPNAKYALGNICVARCPSHLMVDEGSCVKECSPGKHAGKHGRCMDCDGPCPKTCKVDLENDFVHSGNIKMFESCTVVQGRIKILDSTFLGDPYNDIGPLSVDQLSVFETVREVTEFVQVQANNQQFKTLKFLKNLKIIHGRRLDRGKASLQIWQTSLESLGLTSLKHVRNGHIFISNNSKLCLADGLNWTRLLSHPSQQHVIVTNNAAQQSCVLNGHVCSKKCSDDGCWNAGDHQCLSCRFVSLNHKRCLTSCQQEPLLYQSAPQLCNRCHPQCKDGCSGSSNDECTSCLSFKDGPYCVASCPPSKYPDVRGVCQRCHQNCDIEFGCMGPTSSMSGEGCNLCQQILVDNHDDINRRNIHTKTSPSKRASSYTCMSLDSQCPSGYFKTFIHVSPSNHSSNPDGSFKSKASLHLSLPACVKCHPMCIECSGPGASMCTECRHYVQDGKCVALCSQDYFIEPSSPTKTSVFAPTTTKLGNALESNSYSTSFNELIKSALKCTKCESKCLGCYGSSDNCTRCKHYKLMLSGEDEEDFDGPFTCVEDCPFWSPHKTTRRVGNNENDEFNKSRDRDKTIVEMNDDVVEAVCSKYIHLDSHTFSWREKCLTAIVFILLLSVMMVITMMVIRQRTKMKKLQKEQIGKCAIEMVPLAPSHIQPDMSTVRFIRQSELSIGGVIGSGAFGTVYQGVWSPENYNVKIPVAIKVLIEHHVGSGGKELLDEARIMASVKNEYCMHILCVCLSPHIMLVTDLVRYGCMLDFVRKHKDCIGSADLILWSLQIATGMLYLSEKGIVHRDLAARNVLVQSMKLVKITDFGLAKLMDDLNKTSHQQLKSHTKMPIKWLAFESISLQKFTHQSDVWSYGVTIWELLTFGERPYDNINVNDLFSVLMKGERLKKPDVCGIQLYLLLLTCWLIDPSERPTFLTLRQRFSEMHQNPQEYISLPPEGNLQELVNPDEGYRSMKPSTQEEEEEDEVPVRGNHPDHQHEQEQQNELRQVIIKQPNFRIQLRSHEYSNTKFNFKSSINLSSSYTSTFAPNLRHSSSFPYYNTNAFDDPINGVQNKMCANHVDGKCHSEVGYESFNSIFSSSEWSKVCTKVVESHPHDDECFIADDQINNAARAHRAVHSMQYDDNIEIRNSMTAEYNTWIRKYKTVYYNDVSTIYNRDFLKESCLSETTV